jgi:hypothetical protein
MKREIRLAAWAAAGVLMSSLSAGAAPVGSDSFNYPDGSIAGRTGGTGWAAERTNEVGAAPSAPSDWDVAFGTADIVGGSLVTRDSGAIREFNGPSEGATEPSNEREGAFRGAGSVFFGFDMTRQAGADWSGASSYDFAAERIFFGVPGGQTFFGIEESGVGRGMSTIEAVAGQKYRIVAELDFDTDVLNLWVNPAAGDELTPDATRAYTATNWSTAVRLASGGTGSTAWDNLVVASDWNDPGLVPEPGSLALLGMGALGLLRRRR